ncbi:5-(carboxyamino)imidazole ribonucleotide synthase [Blastopirellula retiformator]|uniref:N5-carboxyaminoimidazole ribonucleotide synthase n=1 Tax=Blastopirellula retiformator TaxID=2527970 RepID=A0A5C5UWV7_9BACT|nr:5-(carboxyamino)imidazole ribonucleotide synthase [Blastopirellula retiformator]TWT30668.1 N5-carboxyaminoimidazole ribonucleotide synthase [Blastopirellula retiformator]
MTPIISPGATIGVLGSGQLGRMFTLAARRLGYHVHVFSPSKNTPAGQLADLEIQAPYDDFEAIESFARHVDVVTIEFENVNVEAIEVIQRFVPVRPGCRVLRTTQRRDNEKAFLAGIGVPVAPYASIRNLAELQSTSPELFPGILKTAGWGYDGKGQVRLSSIADAQLGWRSLGVQAAVLEKLIDFALEFSVIVARGANGEMAHYDPILNRHENHILSVSVSPSGLTLKIVKEAVEIAHSIAEQLDVVGVLCVEFFLTKDARVIVNELAPRPHNSGHLTIEAHATCQFEQQVRAVCGLPLGSTAQLRPAAMANLLGDLWMDGEPRWEVMHLMKNVKVHLYGKSEWREGRKMGHLTAQAESATAAEELVSIARQSLVSRRNESCPSPGLVDAEGSIILRGQA